MVRSSVFVATALALLPSAVLGAGDVQAVLYAGSGSAPSAPPPSAAPSRRLMDCDKDSSTCDGKVVTTVTEWNGTTTSYSTKIHAANTTVTRTVEKTKIHVITVPAIKPEVLCPTITTHTVPIPSVVEILVNTTSTDTYITEAVTETTIYQYITDKAISACMAKPTYHILAGSAAPPSPSDGPAIVANDSSAAVVASAAATSTGHVEIEEPEASAIPEPAGDSWF